MSLSVKSLESVRTDFRALVEAFDVHPAFKRFSTSPTHDGGPHIEQDGNVYSYVITERGEEYERRQTSDVDELLFWLVADVTREVAQKYELQHRLPQRDYRRLMFEKHVELLGNIRPNWARRQRAEYDEILKSHPYDDRT
jgi:hypothetical protein